MKKFSLLEGFKYTDEEVEDFFFEFVENKNFKLTHGFVNSENRFIVDVANTNSKCRLCNRVEISIDGILGGVKDQSGSESITDIGKLSTVISTINKFYARSGESVNFIIQTSYDSISITFFLIGELVGEIHSNTKGEIKTLLSELEIVMKSRGYKRVSLKHNNWLEIRTPQYPRDQDTTLRYAIERTISGQIQVNQRNQPLIDWVTKTMDLGYQISYGGGDNQVVVSLKKTQVM